MYKELIEYLVKSLVDNKDAVVLTEAKEDAKTVITVKVDSKDMGRVIGKDGRIIKSIREIVRAYSAKNNDKVVVNIEE
ncbi:MAG: KH domain-containing protein [Clostridia bacterium]|nr:KH domain-containing protein [Clostridia bacterium]